MVKISQSIRCTKCTQKANDGLNPRACNATTPPMQTECIMRVVIRGAKAILDLSWRVVCASGRWVVYWGMFFRCCFCFRFINYAYDFRVANWDTASGKPRQYTSPDIHFPRLRMWNLAVKSLISLLPNIQVYLSHNVSKMGQSYDPVSDLPNWKP